ncbi:MAG TPA: methyltransferase [Pilimelia sp.]|nr:methyltransferase [Pilimelia sp.]
MPLSLGPEEAGAYLHTYQAPGPHLDMLSAVGFRAAGAAARLGVFDALDAGPMSAPDLAGKLGADERALTMLADLLVSFHYLTRSGDRYANSPLTERWLRPGTPGSYLSTLALWQELLFGLWADVEESIRTGRPAVDFYAWLEGRPEMLRQFHDMLAGFADWNAEDILAAVPVPAGPARLLDLGGGHARHSIAFCQRYPDLRATVVDLPGALAVGRDAVAAAGLSDRVSFREGDLATDPIGGDLDLVLLFNVLHGNGPGRNEALLRRVAGALRPGGTVAVLEQLAREERPAAETEAAFVHVFSLNLLHTQGGRLYDRQAVTGWLTGAGFDPPSWQRLPKMPADHLAIATMPR